MVETRAETRGPDAGGRKATAARRAGFLSLCVAGAAATAVAAPAGLVAGGASAGAGSDPQPNIIFVYADDLGYGDTSLYDGEIDTPNIARIAADGVAFTDGYVASPVCSPSRHSMLSGRSASRFGADSNFLGRLVLPDQTGDEPPGPSMARVLNDAGYATSAIGKWDLSGVRRGFTEAEVRGQPNLPHDTGFDEFYGMLNGIADYCPGDRTELFEYDPADDSYRQREPDRYLTDEFSDRAAGYVSRQTGESDPYFLYLSYNAPHVPLQLPGDCETARGDDARPTYEEMVRIMDRGIGRVLTALDAVDGTLGNPDDPNVANTLVVFASDNGPVHEWRTGDLRGRKFGLFEGGIRVPFAMRWPARIAAGTTYSKLASTLDLLPTFAAAAGAPLDTGAREGVDLVPHVADGSPAHRALAWRYYNDSPRNGEAPRGTIREAVRVGDLKYLREVSLDGQVQEFLFDLGRDYDGDGTPDGHTEQVNENANPGYAAERRELIAAYQKWNARNPVREGFDFPRRQTGLPDGWARYSGTWSVDDTGVLRAEAVGAGAVTAAGSYFRALSATVDVRLTSEGEAGMLLRGSDGRGAAQPLDGYRVTLHSGSDTVRLVRVDQGKATLVARAAHPIAPDATYQVRVGVENGPAGDHFVVQLDGPVVLEWTDPAPLPGGSVGLWTADATARFDNLTSESKRGGA